jgi:hypothetical protein
MIERHYKHITAEQIRDKVILPDTNNPVGLTKPSRTSRVAVRIAADGPVEPLVLS